MHESGVDVDTIAMVLGNTSRVVTTYYILSSIRNYDACDIARSLIRGNILKFSNMFLNRNFIQIKKEDINFSDISSDHLFYDH
jgi:hypothetical protein